MKETRRVPGVWAVLGFVVEVLWTFFVSRTVYRIDGWVPRMQVRGVLVLYECDVGCLEV